MLNQIQNIVDDISIEKNQAEQIKKKYELVTQVCKFAFEEDVDTSTVKSLIDSDELYELFSEISETSLFMKRFNEKNINYIEEEYRGTDFLKSIDIYEKELSSTIEKLNRVKKELKQKQEVEKKIQKHKNEIEKYTADIDELNSFLKKYEGRDLQSFKKEYDEIYQIFSGKYNKNLDETKKELDAVNIRIKMLKEHIAEYGTSRDELEKLENVFNEISDRYEEIQQLLPIYKIHFEANLRLDYDKAKGLEENVRIGIEELDQNILDSMETIKKIQEEVREKQK